MLTSPQWVSYAQGRPCEASSGPPPSSCQLVVPCSIAGVTTKHRWTEELSASGAGSPSHHLEELHPAAGDEQGAPVDGRGDPDHQHCGGGGQRHGKQELVDGDSPEAQRIGIASGALSGNIEAATLHPLAGFAVTTVIAST